MTDTATDSLLDSEPSIPEKKPNKKAKPKKPKAPKELSLEKKRELIFTSIFLKGTVRRVGFWYKGLTVGSGYTFVLGSQTDEDFSHGDPKFSIAYIRIKNEEYMGILDDFFKDVGLMDDRIEVVNLKELATQCAKVKWDTNKLSLHRDAFGRLVSTGEHLGVLGDGEPKVAILSTPLISLFVLNTVSTAVDHYRKIIDSDRTTCYSLPFTEDDVPYGIIDVEKESLQSVPDIWHAFQSSIRLATVRGLDLLQKKPLIALAPDVTLSYLFWRPFHDAPVVDYIHLAESKDFDIALSRCYVQIYP